jgi:TolA-binding protein
MSSETFYNLSEACRVTKLSPPTLRKYLSEGRFPNAYHALRGKVQVWAIPLTDLVAADLMGSVTGSDDSGQAPQPLTGEDRLEALAERAGRLQAELDQMRETVKALEQAIIQATKRAEFSELIAQSQIETKQVQEERRSTLLERLIGKKP